MKPENRITAVLLLLATSFTLACATKGYVRRESEAVEQRMSQRVGEVEGQVEQAQTDIQKVEERTAENERQLGELSKTAKDALDRAVAAGELAEGKFLYETVLTDDQVSFGFDRTDLSDGARAALDGFAQQIKSQNQNVYVEIQGHTDSIGSESYNEQLGLERAQAVRRYLNQQHGFPLHRMSVISYGESEPAVANDTRENRSKNRRVVLVVLK